MTPGQALNKFWNRFGITAYDSNTVPDDAKYPRLTYEYAEAAFDEPVLLKASLWYRSLSWSDISQKAEEINEYIGAGGHMEPYEDGAIWVTRATPFVQRMADPEPDIRRVILNIYADFMSNI